MKYQTRMGQAGLKGKLLPAIIVSLAMLSLALAGCAFSDTITQKIYDSDPNSVLDTEAQKVLNNTIDAKKTSDQLPQLTTDNNSKDKKDTDQDLPSYGGDTSNALVSQPVKTQKQATKEIGESEEAEKSATKADGDPNTEEKEGKKSEDGDNGGKKGKGKDPENKGKKKEEPGKGKNTNNDIKTYEDYGEYPEIPEGIKHVAAVGEAATIVSMLGGLKSGTPLVYADEEFVEDKQVQKVLKGRGVSKVKALWDGDGTEEGDLSSKSLKKLIYSDVELCFVMEGDDTLTKKQRSKLLAANIIVYYLPSMATASNILSAVDIVGQILEAGDSEEAGERASAYKKFHKEIVDTCKDENGGITGGFNYDKGKDVSTDASDLYTLVITDWDDTARYVDSSGFLSSAQGVGIADLGYEEAPYAYYLSVGGVNNNASAGAMWRGLSGYSAIVWQFTTSKAGAGWNDWKAIDRSKVNKELDKQGESSALMWNDDASVGLGTEEFPAVIVAAQDMKTKLEKDANSENGLYHPYPLVSVSKGGVVTYSAVGFTNGDNKVEAFIGTYGQGSDSVLNDGDGNVELYDIYVNPAGLFSSWLDGSVESVLESAWAYKSFRNEEYGLDAKIKEFYSSFYGYDLSSDEVTKILDGAKKAQD